jgi:hypothetical protein
MISLLIIFSNPEMNPNSKQVRPLNLSKQYILDSQMRFFPFYLLDQLDLNH